MSVIPFGQAQRQLFGAQAAKILDPEQNSLYNKKLTNGWNLYSVFKMCLILILRMKLKQIPGSSNLLTVNVGQNIFTKWIYMNTTTKKMIRAEF